MKQYKEEIYEVYRVHNIDYVKQILNIESSICDLSESYDLGYIYPICIFNKTDNIIYLYEDNNDPEYNLQLAIKILEDNKKINNNHSFEKILTFDDYINIITKINIEIPRYDAIILLNCINEILSYPDLDCFRRIKSNEKELNILHDKIKNQL